VRTVFKGERSQRGVRRLAPLLVFLFILPSLGGCLGSPPVDWGADEGEYSTSLKTGETGVTGITVNNNLGDSTFHYPFERDVNSCPGDNGPEFHLSGFLVRTKIFDVPISNNTASVASWIIKIMSFEDAQEVEPGDLYFSVLKEDEDWATPTTVEGYEIHEQGNSAKTDEFPHEDWAIVAMVPGHENIFDAMMQTEGNQPIRIDGYILPRGGVSGGTVDEGCNLQNGRDSFYDGVQVEMVVTSITYDNDKVVNSNDEYVAGDIPFVGRGLYTTILLISIIASGALFIFARNQIILSADTQAQSMLSEQQMRAGKSARHEAARHEARMVASTKAKEAEYTGKPSKKSSAAPKFDIGAALAEDSPGTATGHYVAGSSVTSTDEADAMQDMITEMQEEREFEQELQEKGLRGMIGNLPRGGGGMRQSIATKPHTSRLSSQNKPQSEPKPVEEEPEPKRKQKPTRKTRRTRSTESEPLPEAVEEEPEPVRRVDSDVNEDGDFSDFSL